MKKLFTLVLTIAISTALFSQTQIKVTLDTKKFVNIDCSLGADCSGGPSALPKVYMHSGLCTTGDIYCKTQIIPLNSLVWEHVVGNWGSSPQDDGVGEMVNEGNGIYTKTIIVENYYSSAEVSTDWNDTHTVQSTPMPTGATPYTMGLVFRSPDGLLTGRDNMCNDIFVTDINTTTPKVIQSFDLLPWPNSPVTIERNIIGIEEARNINFVNIAPNPLKEEYNIEFYLNEVSNGSVSILDAFGKTIHTIYEGKLQNGKHIFKGQTSSLGLSSGLYFVTISTDFHKVTNKIIVIK